MQQYFYQLADDLKSKLKGEEVFLANYSGEDSDFVRFNQAKVRQPGSVTQRYLTLELINGQRHAAATVALAGKKAIDGPRVKDLLAGLRDRLEHVPEDPYLLYSTEVKSSEQIGADRLPKSEDALDKVLSAGKGQGSPNAKSRVRGPLDMVGLWASGGIHAGFANSLGQRNWFSSHSFNLDWSFYHNADKAVKAQYADFEWDDAAFARKVDQACEQLAVISGQPKTVPPGNYRVYLAPAALEDLVGILCWGGFGLKAHRTKFTPLLKMIAEGATLSPAVTLREATAEGIAPNFQSSGYIKPPSVTLIEAGKYRDCLVSPRSAKEYGQPCNGANGGEGPESLDASAGDIPASEVLSRLGTGVYVNTLWYLNYSDRAAGRITGMTRFATFWVENGRLVAPLNVMRFDETVYRFLGSNLVGLTREREFIPSTSSYGGRSTSSTRMPGALVDDFAFTL
ncbi:MAG: TldD/PmbA family protein [Phycisphaerae bacterium]